MILLDTHIWVWWVHNDDNLPEEYRTILSAGSERLGVSAFSCWEVAKLVEYQRLKLTRPLEEWFSIALYEENIELIPLSPAILTESVSLPGRFHKDPADQVIVATSRVHSLDLMTKDRKIRSYPHVHCM